MVTSILNSYKMASKGGMSKVAKSALLSFFVSSIFIIVAFSTDAWLKTDGTLENPKFIQLGELKR